MFSHLFSNCRAASSNQVTPRICIIGAGFSGLCAAIQLKQQLGLTSFTIFERNKGVGGVWFSNVYPDCACDVPSHAYSFSFELNPNWSGRLVPQSEILKYLELATAKYDICPHIKFETEVKCLEWIEELKKWNVVTVQKIGKKRSDFFDIIINASGVLHQPNIPKEFNSFKGQIFHSAEWDHGIPLDNKVVGIVGSGASAIQIIPGIAKRVDHLHVYQRKAPWVTPVKKGLYPKLLKFIFFCFPFLMKLFRSYLFLSMERGHSKFMKNSKENLIAQEDASNFMKGQVRTIGRLEQRVLPAGPFGCLRILQSNDYYPALTRPNVTVHAGKILEVTETGIVSADGHTQSLDVIILATGFQAQEYFAPLKIIGRDSQNILSAWKSRGGPNTYFGIVSSSLPNYFALLGPNTWVIHNTVTFMMECQVNFTIRIIQQLMSMGLKCVVVKKTAEDEFMTWLREEMKKTIWTSEDCKTWFANETGEITTQWPGNCVSYWFKTRTSNLSNFEFS